MTDVDSHAVKNQLERIVTSEAFHKSKRARDLLTYLVTRTLEDPNCNLDGYNIALDVFGKDGHFDPGQSSTVRVQMGRLRQLLAVFYETASDENKIHISIPKGANRPVFSPFQQGAAVVQQEDSQLSIPRQSVPGPSIPESDPVPPSGGSDIKSGNVADVAGAGMRAFFNRAKPTGAGLALAVLLMFGLIVILDKVMNGPVRATTAASQFGADNIAFDKKLQAQGSGSSGNPIIFVKDFENYSQNENLSSVSKLLELEITSNLSNFKLLETKKFADPLFEADASQNTYSLKGAVFANQETTTLTLVLSHLDDDEVIWSRTYKLTEMADGTFQNPEDRARIIAGQIGGLTGPVHSHSLNHLRNQGPEQNSINQYIYYCVVQLTKLDSAGRAHATRKHSDCAQLLTTLEEPSSLALAALSHYELDAVTAATKRDIARKAQKRALKYALQATAEQPDNDIAYRALATAQALKGNIPAATYAYQRAVSINPADADNKASLGTHLCFNGKWSEGILLIREALQEHPAPPPWYQRALALHHYQNKDYKQALDEALVRLDVERAFNLPIVLSAAIQLDARPVIDQYESDYEQQYKDHKGDILLPLRHYVQDKSLMKVLEDDIEQVRDLLNSKEG